MLSFGDAPGNLFNRLGRLGKVISALDAYQNAQLTNLTDTTYGVVAQYNTESDLQAQIGSSYIGTLNSPGTVGSSLGSLAAATFNRMVFRDNPQISQSLNTLNLSVSINEVIRQMGLAGATIRACTVTATPTGFTGAGNGTFVASVRRPLDGKVLENSFAETVLVTVTDDSYTGGSTEGNEGLLVTGTGVSISPFAFDWPIGSGASVGVSAIDGAASNSSGNLLTNSGWDDWTVNLSLPDNWTLEVGTAGTSVYQEFTITYDPPPNSSLAIVGDGVTLVALKQEFGIASGTPPFLFPLIQYGVNLYIRRGASAGTGTLAVELVDDDGNLISDEGGNVNQYTIDLSALTTTFTAYSGSFRLPRVVPYPNYIRLRMTVALQAGRTVYLDKMGFGVMSQLYTSGPYFAAFSGSVPFEFGDYATCPVTNSRGAAGTLDTFQTLLQRLMFNTVMAEEILFPSSSVPSISDTLITGP